MENMSASAGSAVKVLHVLDHSLPLHSGYVFRTEGMLAAHRSMGIEIECVTGAKHTPSALEFEEVNGNRYYRTHMPSWCDVPIPGMDQIAVVRSLHQRIDQLLDRLKPDLLHVHSPCLNGIAAHWAAKKRKLPWIYEMRASWEDAAVSHGTTWDGSPRYRFSRALETHVLKNATQVVTICEGLRKDIIGRGIESHRVTVVPNAIDQEILPVSRDEALAS